VRSDFSSQEEKQEHFFARSISRFFHVLDDLQSNLHEMAVIVRICEEFGDLRN
jgi:hypothetical protein